MKIVYVAGPFTADSTWEVEQNVRRAEQMGLEVARLGAMPLIPHTNTRFFHGVSGVSGSFWYRGTLELLLRSDAMVVCGDWESSKGSKAELAACDKHDIPFFWTLDDLRVWLEGAPSVCSDASSSEAAKLLRMFRKRKPTTSYASVAGAAALLHQDAREQEMQRLRAELDAAEALVDETLKRAEEGVKTCARTVLDPAGDSSKQS